MPIKQKKHTIVITYQMHNITINKIKNKYSQLPYTPVPELQKGQEILYYCYSHKQSFDKFKKKF